MSRYNSMSKKIDLNKLSPQELLAYAQNLVKQEKSKPSKPVKSTPKSKPVKSIIIKPSTKLSQILSSSGKVLNYPPKMVSIADMRDEELNMTSAPGKLKLTFAELFERRLKLISGKKTNVRVKVEAEVRYSYGITSDLESKERGPFEVNIPKLTKNDMYKLFIYLLLKNGFSICQLKRLKKLELILLLIKRAFSNIIKWADLN